MCATARAASWSWSTTARMTARMSNGFLRPGLCAAENTSPTVAKSRRRRRGCGAARTSRSRRVGGGGAAREPLAGHDVGVLVVGEAGSGTRRRGRRPVLGLAVRAHDAVEAADAEVVLGGDAAGEVERLLAGEHHRALGRHDEDAAGVHEHRRLGVPVGLGADVDAGHDDVDLAAALGELDDPAQHGGDPVHVLGAAVHRDARAGRHREPLERDLHPLGQIERGDDRGGTPVRRACPVRGSGRRAHDPRHALRGPSRCCS